MLAESKETIFASRPTKQNIRDFQALILAYYAEHQRNFEWRTTRDPYKIVVSEFMLQQTQTDRVVAKYAAFIERFDSAASLAQAPFRDVLTLWKGLGYNRRAHWLQLFAQGVMERGGAIPDCQKDLESFKGIGSATASAIRAFAFNQSVAFIETNIRAVFIHFFFKNKKEVNDASLMPIIKKAVYTQDPRNWYYALMDYGVMLKKTRANPARKSAHYTKQSRFEGSDRQIRGKILELLIACKTATLAGCQQYLEELLVADDNQNTERLKQILNSLVADNLLIYAKDEYALR